MTAVVVPTPTINLRNIPERLRYLADQIESGEKKARSLFVVIPGIKNENPQLYGWGDMDGENHPIIQLALCQHWLMHNMVAR
jgi:hypothetical protein